jgi:hypothetical protein
VIESNLARKGVCAPDPPIHTAAVLQQVSLHLNVGWNALLSQESARVGVTRPRYRHNSKPWDQPCGMCTTCSFPNSYRAVPWQHTTQLMRARVRLASTAPVPQVLAREEQAVPAPRLTGQPGARPCDTQGTAGLCSLPSGRTRQWPGGYRFSSRVPLTECTPAGGTKGASPTDRALHAKLGVQTRRACTTHTGLVGGLGHTLLVAHRAGLTDPPPPSNQPAPHTAPARLNSAGRKKQKKKKKKKKSPTRSHPAHAALTTAGARCC